MEPQRGGKDPRILAEKKPQRAGRTGHSVSLSFLKKKQYKEHHRGNNNNPPTVNKTIVTEIATPLIGISLLPSAD